MSRYSTLFVPGIVAALTLTAPLSAAPVLRAGMWKTTSIMEMPEMSVKMKPATVQACVTEADASDPETSLPKGPGKDCKVTEYKVDGKKVTWSTACAGSPPITGKATATFESDSAFKAVMKMNANGHAMTITLDAHRTGDCK